MSCFGLLTTTEVQANWNEPRKANPRGCGAGSRDVQGETKGTDCAQLKNERNPGFHLLSDTNKLDKSFYGQKQAFLRSTKQKMNMVAMQ